MEQMIRDSPWKVIAGMTLGYWAWESYASGNIRVDLLLIYPLLFGGYVYLLWRRLRWWSFAISLALMALNFGFFIKSYSWFQKYPG